MERQNAHKHSKLVSWLCQMHKHELVDQPSAKFFVGHVFALIQYDSEFFTQELQALRARIKLVRLETSEEKFYAIRQECILIFLHDNGLKYLLVGRAHKSFEDEHDGYHVFLLSPAEAKHGVPIGEIVQRIRHRRLVRAYTTYLDGMRSVRGATVLEGGSIECDDMIAARKDEVTDETFVSIDDEVRAKLLCLFMSSD